RHAHRASEIGERSDRGRRDRWSAPNRRDARDDELGRIDGAIVWDHDRPVQFFAATGCDDFRRAVRETEPSDRPPDGGPRHAVVSEPGLGQAPTPQSVAAYPRTGGD